MPNLIQHPTAVVISDLHVGDPTDRALDDFDRDEEFARLLGEVIPREAGGAATLIINGDFIDFPQVLPQLAAHGLGRRFGCTQEESEEKLRRVVAGHPLVFESLKAYLRRGGQVLVLPGNHDVDLHWPSVFEMLRDAVGGFPPPHLSFVVGGEIDERRVHIEHGNQHSFDNRFRHWGRPIVAAPDGVERLERPWGTFFMDTIYNGLEQRYSFINQLHPKRRLAWAALRSFRDDERVPAGVIADLLLFFVLYGKRYLLEHLLGRRAEESPSGGVGELLRSLGPGGSPQRLRAITEEAARSLELNRAEQEPASDIMLLGGDEWAEEEEDVARALRLLGRNDERGMEKRQRQLLRSGEIDLVVFGHTHVPVDGNREPPFAEGDPRRVFNTGSWVPAALIEESERPSWEDLKSYAPTSDIRYMVIALAPTPRARLRALAAV